MHNAFQTKVDWINLEGKTIYSRQEKLFLAWLFKTNNSKVFINHTNQLNYSFKKKMVEIRQILMLLEIDSVLDFQSWYAYFTMVLRKKTFFLQILSSKPPCVLYMSAFYTPRITVYSRSSDLLSKYVCIWYQWAKSRIDRSYRQ